MIEVTLEGMTSGIDGKTPEELMSQAACTCYEATKPQSGKVIKLEDRIVKTGHHTILQHIFANFHIEGISVGDITLGLHLANVFYDSSQRSGRFCADMFANPDIDALMSYLTYAVNLRSGTQDRVRRYLENSLKIYGDNLQRATELVVEEMMRERPNCDEKYIAQNAPKIAQEQMRVFVPVLFPTADFFTINLSALSALQRNTWNPMFRVAVNGMIEAVLKRNPELAYLFPPGNQFGISSPIRINNGGKIRKSSYLKLKEVSDLRGVVVPRSEEMHPWDYLPFDPHFMANNTKNINTEIEISLATMGQDQRHRTIRRGLPTITGNFYLPPIPSKLGLDKEAMTVLCSWIDICDSQILRASIAPYGATVRYEKSASLNAFFHEQGKRLCWCAQEEIYHVSRSLRLALADHPKNQSEIRKILKAVTPPCVNSGKCGEGTRYCRRNISDARVNPFPKRII